MKQDEIWLVVRSVGKAKDPEGMFVKWWNRTVDNQCKGQKIRKYYIVNGEYMEAKED